MFGTEDLPTGASIHRHRHPGADEILFLQNGSARVSLGDSTREVHGGATVFIPAGIWIAVTNVGTDAISCVVVFSAPGFEDYMRAESVPEGQKITLSDQGRRCTDHEGARQRSDLCRTLKAATSAGRPRCRSTLNPLWGGSPWLLIPALGSLALFAWLLTLHPTAAGRVYAAYGGVYICVAIAWLWLIDGNRPTSWDFIGAAIAVTGMVVANAWPTPRLMEAAAWKTPLIHRHLAGSFASAACTPHLSVLADPAGVFLIWPRLYFSVAWC